MRNTIFDYAGIEVFIQALGFIAVIITFLYQNRQNKRITKREIYQRVELASIDLFRFEIDNSELTWKLYDENFSLPESNTKEYRDILNHITQITNLFEMVVEFRKEKIIDNRIFSTWITWIWEMAQSKNFREVWKNNSTHYTSELQCIINLGIDSEGDWNNFIDQLTKKYKCNHICKLKN